MRNGRSGDGEGFDEPFVDSGDGFVIAGSGPGDDVGEFLRPEDGDISGGEGTTEQGPVGVNEAGGSRGRISGSSVRAVRTSSACLSTPSTSLLQSRDPTSSFLVRSRMIRRRGAAGAGLGIRFATSGHSMRSNSGPRQRACGRLGW